MKSQLSRTFIQFLYLFKESSTRFSLLFVILLITVTTIYLSLNKFGITYEYQIGDIAEENIRVPWDITYLLNQETVTEKERVMAAVPLVFDMNRSILMDRIQHINMLFSHIDTVVNSPDGKAITEESVKIAIIQDALPDTNKYSENIIIALLRYKDTESLRLTTVRILNDIYERGILEEEYSNPIQINNKNVVVRTIGENDEYVEERRSLDSLHSLDSIMKGLNALSSEYTEDLPKNQRWAIYLVVKENIIQNVRFNREETKRRLQQAANAVAPVTGVLKKGQVIVREGDSVTSDSLKLIGILNSYTSRFNAKYVVGIVLFQIAFYFILGLFMRGFNKIIRFNRQSLLIATMLLIGFFTYSFVVVRTIDYMNTNMVYALYLPVTFITMVVTILFSVPMGMLAGIYIIFFIMMLTGASFGDLAIAFNSVFLGIFTVKTIEKRVDFLKTGFLIGFANSVIILTLVFMNNIPQEQFFDNVQLSIVSGFVNCIAVMGIFPLFEHFFGITTQFKLFELTDLNAPIFKEMLIKAPGTYNHSILVANMAEAACKEIGANSLLTRVGSYYHDIGKLKNPHIFIENMSDKGAVNLSPHVYSKRIIGHVKEGVKLARENDIPQDIIDFIEQHHGDSVMTFFYHQALDIANKSKKKKISVEKSDFSYSGPKPQTKETAIVMLADAIEAASRSLVKPTEEKLEQLVSKIVSSRLTEGTLDEADLTMNELSVIKNGFVSVLTGIFHTRMKYPDQKSIKSLEKKIKQNNSK
ncbi:MAG: HDIG domain-containing protein [Spirochaetes bacterium]|jgi:putative nucleotidyltransferase with HDIG domain|nr:HDIG domain-containing protein [Spirochaetota bacterium]